MRYRVCDQGHITKGDHFDPRCEVCGGRLQESSALTALCLRLEGQTFKVVEFDFEEQSIQVEEGAVVKGPIEGLLLVTMPHSHLQALANVDELGAFAEGVEGTIKKAGWDGEVMVISETMKMARFEPVS